jgi:hypothetical protein
MEVVVARFVVAEEVLSSAVMDRILVPVKHELAIEEASALLVMMLQRVVVAVEAVEGTPLAYVNRSKVAVVMLAVLVVVMAEEPMKRGSAQVVSSPSMVS